VLRTILANVFLIFFLLTEVILRRKGEAKSLQTDKSDKGSTAAILVVYLFSIGLLIGISLVDYGFFRNDVIGLIGLILMPMGLVLRFWSMKVLGGYYSRTLRIVQNQSVVTTGPYRVVRHPGYLSSICLWVGAGLSFENFVLIGLYGLIFITVYVYRIIAEEKMLVRELGDEYSQYQKRSWKLFPLIY